MNIPHRLAILWIAIVLSITVYPASAQNPPSAPQPLTPGEHVLAATYTVDTYWLPGWGAVPPRRTEEEKMLLPDGYGWTQVWRYKAPTFEFAYQYREGRPLRKVLWPETPQDTSIVFKEKNLTFSQELIIDRNGVLSSFLPDPSFEVRSGTESSRIIRINGTAAAMKISLVYEFDVGMPGPIIIVSIHNPLEEDVTNLRVILRSAQRGSWNEYATLDTPGGKMKPAHPNIHPEKAIFFTVRSAADDVDITFGQSKNTGLYYVVQPGEWTVDLSHNLIKLGKGGDAHFSTGIVLLPDAQGGIKPSLKFIRLLLPSEYLETRPDYLNRGFATVESPIRFVEGGAGKPTSSPASVEKPIRGVAYSHPETSLPQVHVSAKEKQRSSATLNWKLLKDSGQNTIVFTPANDPQKAAGIYAGAARVNGIAHSWAISDPSVNFADFPAEIRPTGLITWQEPSMAGLFSKAMKSLKDSGKDLAVTNQADLSLLMAEEVFKQWDAQIRSASAIGAGDGHLLLLPLVSDNRQILGAPVLEKIAACRSLSRLNNLSIGFAYGGMDENLLAAAVATAREAGIQRVHVVLYPDLWNDPAIFLRCLAASRSAGASGAIAFSLGGKWPSARNEASWQAWELGTRAFFPDAESTPVLKLSNAGPLLQSMATKQWTVVASPLDEYKSPLNKIEKLVPNRFLTRLNLPPSADTRTGTLMLLIGMPTENLGVMHALKTEECGLRLADLKGLDKEAPVMGFGNDKLILTGVSKKGVNKALDQFIEICKALEPRIKPEKKD